MSILQADGIQFSDGSVLNTFYGIIQQNKKLVFYQAAAPTGWTKITTAPQALSPATSQSIDNTGIRLVTGTTGGFISGSTSFTSSMPSSPKTFQNSTELRRFSGTVGNHTLTTAEIPSHSHSTGSREVDDGPPAPTSYQTTLQRSYADRTPTNVQTAYQQPVVYQQPVAYQQPSAYQQPANRRARVNRQQPGTYQQPSNPIQRVTRQTPTQAQNNARVQQSRNDRVVQRNPIANNARTGSRTPINRRQANPQTRNARVRNRQRNPVSNPNPQTRNARINRNERDRARRRNRRGRRRNRRRGRQPNPRQQPQARNVQVTNNSRNRVNIRNPQARSAQVQVPRTTQGLRRNPYIQNRREGIRVPQNRRVRTPQANPFNVQNPVQQTNPNPIQTTTPYRTPRTTRQRNNTRIVANTRVVANKNVNANTNQPVNVPSNSQNPVVNFSPYPLPLLVPGDTIRGDNTSAPNTSSTGSNQAHTHPFLGDNVNPLISAPSGLNFRVQYIDVIICSLD